MSAAGSGTFVQLSGDVTSTLTGGTTTVKGLNGVPFCTGFTPTTGQAVEYTTASSPNPCYTAATPSGATFTALSGDATSTSTGGATTVKGINGVLLSGLGTGLLYDTTGTGVPATISGADGLYGVTETSSVPSLTALGTAALVNTGTSGATIPVLNGALTFSGANAYGTPASITLTNATGLPNASVIGLGTAALVNTGTSGATIPLLNGVLTFAGANAYGTPASIVLTNATGYPAAALPTITLTGDTTGAASGGSIATTTAKINGTAFAGTNGHFVSFGAANIPADSGVVAANAVLAVSPSAGLAHFAGATQTVTSSAVSLTADVTGLLPHANIAATAVTPGAYTSANITIAADGSITAAANGSSGGVTSIATTSPITGGTITTTGTIACATCVVATTPGAGIAHFAGSTQTVTSSAVSLTADVSGILPIVNGGTNASSAAAGTIPYATSSSAASWSATPTLGASGTLGSLTMGNATSGTVTIQPVTGALGTVTASFPANTGTVAETNLAQTFSAAQTIGGALALGTSQVPYLTLQNTTASLSSGATVQVSPSTLWSGTAYQTTAAASQTLQFQSYVLPVTGTVLTGSWVLQSNINGAGFNTVFSVGQTGTAVFANSVQSNGDIFQGNGQVILTNAVNNSLTTISNVNFSTAGGGGLAVNMATGTVSNTSGLDIGVQIQPTINQASGNGSYTVLNIAPKVTTTQGGTYLLTNWQVGSAGTTSVGTMDFSGNLVHSGYHSASAYKTATNCSNAASPAVCGASAAGSVAIPTGVTSVALVVNTTAVTATSEILLVADDSLTIASTTCNSTLATLVGGMAVTARTAGTSFTITYNGTIATNPLCVSFSLMN